MGNDITRVFLVDDDEITLELFKASLEADNLVVGTSSSTEDIVAKIKEFRPDVIILDKLMPIYDGFAVCSQLKQDPDLQDVPTLMLTSDLNTGSTEKGRSVGIIGFLSKPIAHDTLIAVIKQQDAIHQVKKAWHTASTTLDSLLEKYSAPY